MRKNLPSKSCQLGKNDIGIDAILTPVIDMIIVFFLPKLSDAGPAKNAPTNAATLKCSSRAFEILMRNRVRTIAWCH